MDNAIQTATQQAPQPAPAARAPSATGEKPFVSAGQQIHKWGTYASVDWGLNYLTGMLFACWGRYTRVGQRVWKAPLNKAATWISSDLLKIKGTESIGNFEAFINVIAGGTFTIPPLLYMEHRRMPIVKWLDRKIYGQDQVENDPKFAESYDAMEHEPKAKGWVGNVTRYGSLAPLLATVMFPRPREFTKPYFDKVAAISGNVYKKAGLTPERLFKNYSPAERETEWKWLHTNSAIDFGLEPWYALLHMLSFRSATAILGERASKKEVGHAAPHVSHRESAPAPETKQPEARIDTPDSKVNAVNNEKTLAVSPAPEPAVAVT